MATPTVKTFEVENEDELVAPSPLLRTFSVEAETVDGPAISPTVKTFEVENEWSSTTPSPLLRTFSVEAETVDAPLPTERSFFRQQTQIASSLVFDDDFTIANAESAGTNLQDDLNFLRSVLKNLKGTPNWNSSTQETIEQISAQTKLPEKKILHRIQKLADVTVPGGQNFVELANQATPITAELPSESIAINSTTEGAVVAQLGGALGSHSLATASGNGNIVEIRDATTNDSIFEGDLEIKGLLQVPNTATDGAAFDSSSNQAQISFVTFDPVGDVLQAASVSAIENRVIEYSYLARTNLNDMPENLLDLSFVSGDPVLYDELTLDSAYDGGSEVTVDTADVEWRLDDTLAFEVTDSSQVNIFAVNAAAGNDSAVFDVDTLDIDNTNNVDMSSGLDVDTGSATITIDAGAVSLASNVSFESTGGTAQLSGSGDASVLSSSGEVFLDDSRTGAIPLSDGSNTGLFGSATSLLGAINAAGAAGGVDLTIGRVSVDSTVPANTVVTAGDVTTLGDAPNGLVAYDSLAQFTDNLFIFLNGQLLANGESSFTNNDVYAAGNAANGEMAFEFDLEAGDIIQIVKLVQ